MTKVWLQVVLSSSQNYKIKQISDMTNSVATGADERLLRYLSRSQCDMGEVVLIFALMCIPQHVVKALNDTKVFSEFSCYDRHVTAS